VHEGVLLAFPLHTHAHTHTYIHTHTYTHTCTLRSLGGATSQPGRSSSACTRACCLPFYYTHTHIHTRTHTHTHIHKRTHTRTHTCTLRSLGGATSQPGRSSSACTRARCLPLRHTAAMPPHIDSPTRRTNCWAAKPYDALGAPVCVYVCVCGWVGAPVCVCGWVHLCVFVGGCTCVCLCVGAPVCMCGWELVFNRINGPELNTLCPPPAEQSCEDGILSKSYKLHLLRSVLYVQKLQAALTPICLVCPKATSCAYSDLSCMSKSYKLHLLRSVQKLQSFVQKLQATFCPKATKFLSKSYKLHLLRSV